MFLSLLHEIQPASPETNNQPSHMSSIWPDMKTSFIVSSQVKRRNNKYLVCGLFPLNSVSMPLDTGASKKKIDWKIHRNSPPYHQRSINGYIFVDHVGNLVKRFWGISRFFSHKKGVNHITSMSRKWFRIRFFNSQNINFEEYWVLGMGTVRDGTCPSGGKCPGWEMFGMGSVRTRPRYKLWSKISHTK